MQPDEWPLAAEAADRPVDPARRAGPGRLATVRADFFLDSAERLTEQERALMTALLYGLVSGLADEVRAALPPHLAAASDEDSDAFAAGLSASGLFTRDDLIGLLLRRADEERIGGAMRALAQNENASLIQSMVSDDDPALSEAAMALILARGRRRDRFGRLLLDFDDLPAEAAVALVNAVAASLRPNLVPLDPTGADRALQAAAATVLARHDEGLRLDAHVAVLARALDVTGRLDDSLLNSAANEGEIALVAHSLARRAGIASDEAWDLLIVPEPARLARLLRMAACPRPVAAAMLAGLGKLLGVGDPVAAIGDFDRTDSSEAAADVAWLRLDPAYRHAVNRMEGANGQRPVR